MKKVQITIKVPDQHAYKIVIGSGILTNLSEFIKFRGYSQAAIITDTNVAKFHLPQLQESLPIENQTIILPAGEREKTINNVESIWKELVDNKYDRKTLVLNLGGGVIGDIGGFAASTYMRGVDFINIPTSVLAQVDASVGGKTGIDYAGIKNLVGTFEQPRAVIIDVDVLKTLSDREFNSGFAEIIKHGLICDNKYYETVTAKKPREFTSKELITVIADSVDIKKNIVEEDTNEMGVRRILNFGHTMGHAIESLSLQTDKPLLHGEAVSIGVVAELYISHLKRYISLETVEKVKHALAQANLPVTTQRFPQEQVFEKIKSDKKNISGKVKWTLLKEIGEATYNEEVNEALVTKAYDFISK